MPASPRRSRRRRASRFRPSKLLKDYAAAQGSLSSAKGPAGDWERRAAASHWWPPLRLQRAGKSGAARPARRAARRVRPWCLLRALMARGIVDLFTPRRCCRRCEGVAHARGQLGTRTTLRHGPEYGLGKCNPEDCCNSSRIWRRTCPPHYARWRSDGYKLPFSFTGVTHRRPLTPFIADQ
jgi:hypothetical protein